MAQIDLVKVATGDETELRKLYLDYVNDFLTYQGVADYYGWSIETATRFLNQGHDLYYGQTKP